MFRISALITLSDQEILGRSLECSLKMFKWKLGGRNFVNWKFTVIPIRLV